MARLMAKRPTTMKRETRQRPSRLWGQRPSLGQYLAQEEIKGKKQEPKRPRILNIIKDKYKLERIAEPENARVVEMV